MQRAYFHSYKYTWVCIPQKILVVYLAQWHLSGKTGTAVHVYVLYVWLTEKKNGFGIFHIKHQNLIYLLSV